MELNQGELKKLREIHKDDSVFNSVLKNGLIEIQRGAATGGTF
jgi:hypothetical protein